MTDEKYTFVEDLREKKKTATGAYHKRTHCGKGGAVKFPSDFMTKKEIMAMNGEVKAYKLNDPMTWAEFKKMPDDIRITYIKALREKFGANDSKISEMMGVSQACGQREIARLGLGLGRGGNRVLTFDKDGWYAWVNGVKLEKPEEVTLKVEDMPSHTFGRELYEPIVEPPKWYAPSDGTVTFEGKATDALATLSLLLGEANVKLRVSWEVAK